MRISKPLEGGLWIVADSGYPQARLLQGWERLLQLDELGAAKRSPIGAAGEDQQHSFGSHQLVQRQPPAVLILKREVRDLAADGRASFEIGVLQIDELFEFGRIDLFSRSHLFENAIDQFCAVHRRVLLSGRSTRDPTGNQE